MEKLGLRELQFSEEKVTVIRVGSKVQYHYDLNEYQLTQLKRTTSGSIFRDFGIALFTIFFTLLITLFTVELKDPLYVRILTDVTVFSFVAAVILLAKSYQDQQLKKNILDEIEEAINRRKRAELANGQSHFQTTSINT